jgi:hypothetical protein
MITFIFHIKIEIAIADDFSPLIFQFWFPSAYPDTSAPEFDFRATWLTQDDKTLLQQQLLTLWTPGEVVIFQCIEWLRENTNTFLSLESRKQSTPKEPVYEKEIPIQSGDPFTVNKSKFVAHAAEVHSLEEVYQVIAQLKKNKKIENATHNMFAYRFYDASNHLVENRDDDGETGAADQILFLMQRAQVENVVVVVTRWFGGIMLGSDRFRIITNVAKELLQQLGYISSTKKKNKKQS